MLEFDRSTSTHMDENGRLQTLGREGAARRVTASITCEISAKHQLVITRLRADMAIWLSVALTSCVKVHRIPPVSHIPQFLRTTNHQVKGSSYPYFLSHTLAAVHLKQVQPAYVGRCQRDPEQPAYEDKYRDVSKSRSGLKTS